MKFYCHVPKLLDFALHTACDDIVKHGKQGLQRAMPRPLYYRCIMTFAEKYGRGVSSKKMYDDVRRGISPNLSSIPSWSCLDHVVLNLDGGDTDIELFRKLANSVSMHMHHDVDGFIECLHRLGARCIAQGKSEVMMMSEILNSRCAPCKAIRDVTYMYGALLDTGNIYNACMYGEYDLVRRAVLDSGRDGDFIVHFMSAARDSGDIEMVRLLMNGTGVEIFEKITKNMDASNLTVKFCEQLLEIGVFKRGRHLNINSCRSTAVIQWLIDHDILDIDEMLYRCVRDAASTEGGGHYIHILHYLIETLHLTVPKDALLRMVNFCTYDLGVLDYLPCHGMNINVLCDTVYEDVEFNGALTLLPMYLRYWIDSGMDSKRMKFAVLHSCITNDLPRYVFDVCMEMMTADVHVVDPETGMTLLHCACPFSPSSGHQCKIQYFNYLLQQQVSVNVKSDENVTPLHIACSISDVDVVGMLIDHGAHINARDHDNQTPLLAAISRYEVTEDLIGLLLECGANVHVPDSRCRTPLHAACRLGGHSALSIVEMLLEHGAKVDIRDNDNHTPFDIARDVNVKNLLKRYGYKP